MKQISIFYFLFFIFYSFIHGEANTDLLEFAGRGDLAGVKKSISEKANINFKDSNGTTALMYAANNDHLPVVRFLVDNKSDLFARNTNGWTAAVMAGARGNKLIKEYLESEERKITKNRITGIILKVVGEAYVDNKRLQIGDSILENETVFVAKKSFCDIQVKQSASEFMLRLKENTVFSLKFKDDSEDSIFAGLVKYGSVLFKIKKVPSGEKIQTMTPTIVASVRGTAYEVNVDSEKNTKISMYNGIARTRIRASEIEEDDSISESPQVKNLISSLEDNGQIVSVGNSLDISSSKHKKILEKANAEGLRQSALNSDSPVAANTKLSLRCSEKPTIKKIDSAELKKKQLELEELVGLDPEKLKNTSDNAEIFSLIEGK
ncbi:MAG: ankyrin repeat domain-containing protein [Leptospiraceae bacterium]|nr:ankyrin repeat domain-containing protein [Leptospiraceae bacterium]